MNIHGRLYVNKKIRKKVNDLMREAKSPNEKVRKEMSTIKND